MADKELEALARRSAQDPETRRWVWETRQALAVCDVLAPVNETTDVREPVWANDSDLMIGKDEAMLALARRIVAAIFTQGYDDGGWRARQWPPPGTDTGRRAGWLNEVSHEDIIAAARYARGVLEGNDLVEPDARRAEQALSLVAGLATGSGVDLRGALDQIEGTGPDFG